MHAENSLRKDLEDEQDKTDEIRPKFIKYRSLVSKVICTPVEEVSDVKSNEL